MKKIINIIKNDIKNNKIIYVVGLIMFVILIYTHINTFVANDDLPYSFFYRGNERVKTLGQVLSNQLADYKNLNGRFFVHCVLQIVLLFGKNLWSIINPIMIVVSLILLVKIIKLKLPNVNNFGSILLAFICFLVVINYKGIIYWVAGSVNYVWVLTLLLIVLYLYYRYGFSKYKLINIFGIAFLCALHECTMVFTIVFMIGTIVIDFIKNKKINKTWLCYCFGFLGSLFLLLSPASHIRMVSDNDWNQMSIISKLLLSIPIVSKNLFNLKDITNILPYLFIISVLVNLFKNKEKTSLLIMFLITINMLTVYIFNNNWLYFSLILLLILGEYYVHIKTNNLDLCILSLSMYAVIFSNIITPLYYAARPNYYFYIYMIFYIIYTFNLTISSLNESTIRKINIIVFVPFILLTINEIFVYSKIGQYHKERLNQIDDYKTNGFTGTLELVKIPDKYGYYHFDINNPTKDWFTYRYFLNYYGLPENIEIVYK